VIPGKKRGESDQGDVKNGEGKTEKLKMFLIFGGLPRLFFTYSVKSDLINNLKKTATLRSSRFWLPIFEYGRFLQLKLK
jgi:hypothetical protein